MLDDLSLNSVTKQLLRAYAARPGHALLLSGPRGSGLGTIARRIGRDMTLQESSVVVVVPDEKGAVSIERIRQLYVETRAKHSTRRAIIIDNAECMSIDAQNAFLKLLEEPAANTHFVLTTHDVPKLLATIISRLQHIRVRPLSREQTRSFLAQRSVHDHTKAEQLMFIAPGLPAELQRLIDNDAYFSEQATLVREAKLFLSGTTYERLVYVSRIKDRQHALTFLSVLAGILRFSVAKNTVNGYARVIDSIEQSVERLEANGHVRTHLVNLACSV